MAATPSKSDDNDETKVIRAAMTETRTAITRKVGLLASRLFGGPPPAQHVPGEKTVAKSSTATTKKKTGTGKSGGAKTKAGAARTTAAKGKSARAGGSTSAKKSAAGKKGGKKGGTSKVASNAKKVLGDALAGATVGALVGAAQAVATGGESPTPASKKPALKMGAEARVEGGDVDAKMTKGGKR